MSVERLFLPDDQWADIERRPTHGVIRRIGKETERLGRTDPLAGEDVIIGNLVKDWSIKDENGDARALPARCLRPYPPGRVQPDQRRVPVRRGVRVPKPAGGEVGVSPRMGEDTPSRL